MMGARELKQHLGVAGRRVHGVAQQGQGAVEVAGGSPWPGSTLMRVMDTYTLVFVNGRTVAGVQEAETPELAVDLARALNAGLAAAQ